MITNEIQKENYLRLAEVLIHLENLKQYFRTDLFQDFRELPVFFLQVYEKLRSIF